CATVLPISHPASYFRIDRIRVHARFPEVIDLNGAWATTRSHLVQTGQLLCKYGLLLATILLGARLLETLLMRLAVELGILHRFAGLVAVIMVILLQLIVFVAMFVVL